MRHVLFGFSRPSERQAALLGQCGTDASPDSRDLCATLEQYGKYIEIKRFDAAAEIKKVCSHYESNTQRFSNLTEELVKIYESQELVDSQSDLMRLFLLYNYGGAWMDSDTLLVQSLSPLLEEEWGLNWVHHALVYTSITAQGGGGSCADIENLYCRGGGLL